MTWILRVFPASKREERNTEIYHGIKSVMNIGILELNYNMHIMNSQELQFVNTIKFDCYSSVCLSVKMNRLL